jgi:hypothetical protein
MKTPKEKALDLVDRFIQQTRNRFDKESMSYRRAKMCALITVDEVLEECRLEKDWFWKEVKQEIEKL